MLVFAEATEQEEIMDEITKESVLELRNASGGHRICFGEYHMPKKNDDGKWFGKIDLPFGTGIINLIFPHKLFPSPFEGGRVWRSIGTEEEFQEIEAWCKDREEHVYLRDCLYASAALAMRSIDGTEQRTGVGESTYTEVGEFTYKCKTKCDDEAMAELVNRVLEFIKKHLIYKECALISAVPPKPNKDYHLPSTLVERLSETLKLLDITDSFEYAGNMETVEQSKDIDGHEAKWENCERFGLCFQGNNIHGKNVLLIDDNYQSGITMQYVAMLLQNAGASRVYGLAMTKTRGDGNKKDDGENGSE